MIALTVADCCLMLFSKLMLLFVSDISLPFQNELFDNLGPKIKAATYSLDIYAPQLRSATIQQEFMALWACPVIVGW